MTLIERITMIFRSRANAAVDRYEDPQRSLDYAYRNQLEALQQVRRGIADVATSRHRLEIQANELHAAMGRLQQQAQRAVDLKQDELAHLALSRRADLAAQLAEITRARDGLYAQETKLTDGFGQLQIRLEGFRIRAETIRATYSAAEAQSRIGESLGGLNKELAEVSLTMARAEQHAAQMQARSAALDEMNRAGTLEDPTRPFSDPVARELDRISGEHQVDAELSLMKADRAARLV
ncbi:PspA/IM30 family protein [Paeniglutamicibacter antarcticus]|uniref:PspA/IM30 family protein n=1 Tax=Arthrobacter terrae TaxID=2935737 RepID=A0A931CSM8_9MICC|nr:PspA/IM30 family protein [Arthrobacter terrae]MBG0740161.1 PspA/IM30 family protein [Arthrobacter terrae]